MQDQPRFRFESEYHATVRDMVLSGSGVRASCRSCGHVAERTAQDLLDRHWSRLDLLIGEILSRTACPNCGSKAVSLAKTRGDTPFPVDPNHMSWEGPQAQRARMDRLEAWIMDRRAREGAPARSGKAKPPLRGTPLQGQL